MCKDKVKTGLIISVALNLILAGYILGCSLNKDYGRYKSKWRGFDLRKIEQSAIADDKKQLITSTLKSLKEYKKTNYKEMRNIKEDVKQILSAENYDDKAFKTQVAKIKALKNKIIDKMGNTISELAGQLSANERKVLADAMGKGRAMKQKR